MAQAEYQVTELPGGALEASAHFYAEHLDAVRAQMGEGDLVIILPAAPHDHKDWRQALARTLAREYAPVRVNVVGAHDAAKKEALCAYLAGAKGVTGHYCEAHE